jgi:hypothetical protein
VISEELFFVGCYIVLLLKRKGWNELIGHPKDQGKNHLNSRKNSLQPDENDASQLTWVYDMGIHNKDDLTKAHA